MLCDPKKGAAPQCSPSNAGGAHGTRRTPRGGLAQSTLPELPVAVAFTAVTATRPADGGRGPKPPMPEAECAKPAAAAAKPEGRDGPRVSLTARGGSRGSLAKGATNGPAVATAATAAAAGATMGPDDGCPCTACDTGAAMQVCGKGPAPDAVRGLQCLTTRFEFSVSADLSSVTGSSGPTAMVRSCKVTGGCVVSSVKPALATTEGKGFSIFSDPTPITSELVSGATVVMQAGTALPAQ
mmetsp:Transcript_22694/g.57218  ORF Transcript_22694/g.57218 Transcript_22694/m.57218 type:complete len:240 (+) Transcript_22694:215-934(+)